MQQLLGQTLKELKYRNYSPRTIRAYLDCLKVYFNYLQSNFKYVDEEKIKSFLLRNKTKDIHLKLSIFI